MPRVEFIRGRNVKGYVEAHGEVLFEPGGDVYRWQNRLTKRVRAATIAAAPTNSRPRWAHYGKPLKDTIKATGRPRRGINKFHLYTAVGSTAGHALYVDQGTGVFGGNGPYPAKILPPWQPGSPSLYEHTWRPGGKGRVAPVMIKGQPGQHFFDEGLARGMASMRMRSFQVPGEGASGVSGVLNSAPGGLAGFLGNTVADGAFIASLTQWREWRDEAWNDPDRGLGRGGGIGSKAHASATAGGKPPTHHTPSPPSPPSPPHAPSGYATLGEKRAAGIKVFKKQNPNVVVIRGTSSGLLVKVRDGTKRVIPWSSILHLAP